MSEVKYNNWFLNRSGHPAHLWQLQLSKSPTCNNRLIRIPTGMGKTLGVLLAWLWYRVEQKKTDWPRRLIWCLPMRVLVEQTAEAARKILNKQNLLWDGKSDHASKVGVHVLMGGVDGDKWHLHPEQNGIFIGTQDMLLSRALNRGYASGRARWPMEFGLLNHDCLWVMDEVQLMDVSLATSVQLQAFREQDSEKRLRPCFSWWMSATLQPDWLETVDFKDRLEPLRNTQLMVPPEHRNGTLWDIPKKLDIVDIPAAQDTKSEQLAENVLRVHEQSQAGEYGRITLVIVNTVKSASDLHKILAKKLSKDIDLRLVHSRFRGLERREWSKQFLSKEHCKKSADRIIIATQVVEAGVDISATALVTELAPWASLVQRFGRAARYDGSAQIVVVDRKLSDKNCLPYTEKELFSAREALEKLNDVGIRSLEDFESDLEQNDPGLLKALYPYDPLHILTRRECDELFDTSPDLTGADLDISRYIRSGDERDLLVCWADWPLDEKKPPLPEWQPLRDGLCRVPVGRVRKWLFDKGRLKEGCRAWVWDYLDGFWRKINERDIYPGRTILVDESWGGYDIKQGFTGDKPGKKHAKIEIDAGLRKSRDDGNANWSQDSEDQSMHPWKTIATHGREASEQVQRLAQSLTLPENLSQIMELAARVHDWGKCHPAFQSSIIDTSNRPKRNDLAKAPSDAWASREDLYCKNEEIGPRKGFRHELAGVLGLFELLAQHDRFHDALLGDHRDFIDAGVLNTPSEKETASPPSTLVTEISKLDAAGFNLLTYLVCCHHGKVRGSIQAAPADQKFLSHDSKLTGTGQPVRGVREGDNLAGIELVTKQGLPETLPDVVLYLDPASLGLSNRYGASWSQRVYELLDRYGPFTLAWLETLLRVADIRASQLDTHDPLLEKGGQE